ncbi:hypothetical protein AB0P37_30880 [Streptomyces antimycoticus]|uniref:hypothetical protein n=1 Tax=Streptomyces antimycoticus TaxID=68175 RepID=UPI0034335075
MSTSDGNAVLVNALSSSVRSTLNGMETAPSLIRRVLEENSWRSFITPRGEQATHDTFESFIVTPPTVGLGKSVEEIVRIVGDDEETLALLASALDVPSESLRAPDVQRNDDPIGKDARDFGAYARGGGWVFALKVARSVQPGIPQVSSGAEQSRRHVGAEQSSKVSAVNFARLAGCSPKRVMRFYRAWEKAAEAGIVPMFEELTPGVDVQLPELDLWGEYFSSAARSTDRHDNIAAEAEAEGTSYAGALHVAHHPGDLRTAILADAQTAEAACHALMRRMEGDPALQAAMARTVAEVPQLKRAVASETKKADQLSYVRRVAEDAKLKTPAGQLIEAPADIRAEAVKRLEEIERLADDGPAESVTEAYEAVHRLVSETIEADPKVQVEEQKARVRRALSISSKNIASVSEVPLADIVDDELLDDIAQLQESVNALAELIKTRQANHLRVVGHEAV